MLFEIYQFEDFVEFWAVTSLFLKFLNPNISITIFKANIDHFNKRRRLKYHEPCLRTPIEGPGCTRNKAKGTFILKTNRNI